MVARIAWVLGLVAAGALLTVALAWIALAASERRLTTVKAAGWPPGSPGSWPAPGTSSLESGAGVRVWRVKAEVNFGYGGSDYDLRSPVPATAPSWQTWEASVIECGWPWPALRSRQWAVATPAGIGSVPPRPSLGEAGLPVAWAPLPKGAMEDGRLPVSPVWPGFALGTALWAALLALVWRIPHALRWCYRRRCGLCTACAFPAGSGSICTECGRAVAPWRARGRPVRAYSPRALRRAARACFVAIAVAAALYAASGWASFYVKGPRGWYGAVWQGHIAVGKSDTPFTTLGIESSPHGGYRLLFRVPARLVGAWVCVPLWVPVPALVGVGLVAWWHAAVRRGLALHWPVPGEG